MQRKFKSETDFRTSLQTRLLVLSKEKEVNIQELMKKVAFDRFLCRIFSDKASPWLLKGGYALELQSALSRATKDIDLVLRSSQKVTGQEADTDFTKEVLIDFLKKEQGDYFEYILTGKSKNLDNAPYGGSRYYIECRIAKKRFINFYTDISVNDVSKNPYYETIQGENWLGFAGISPSIIKVLASEEIFAEKLHAYTLPRENENSWGPKFKEIAQKYKVEKGLEDAFEFIREFLKKSEIFEG